MAIQGDLSSGAMNTTPYTYDSSDFITQYSADDFPEFLSGSQRVADNVNKVMAAFKPDFVGDDTKAKLSIQDWYRSEQSSNNAYLRDLAQMREQNAFNSSEAQKQRDYETEMSNTAYQRAIADMKKAGINPLLAVQQGGASTPSGASASSGSVGSRSGHSFSTVGTRSLMSEISGLIHSVGSVAGAFTKLF